MPRGNASKTNIWGNSFKSGGEVKGTKVKNGVQSKTAVSSINTSGRSTIAYSVTAAIVALSEKRCSIGRVANSIWCECQSGNIPGRRYIISYEPTIKRLEAFVAENKQEIVYELVNDSFAHWSLFVPRIIEVMLNDPNGEIASSFKEVFNQMSSQGIISGKNELHIMNDYLYETRHEYIQENSEVNIIKASNPILKEDITDTFIGVKGNFEFAGTGTTTATSSTTSNTTKAKKGSKKFNYELDWPTPLSAEHQALVPNFDLSIMKITKELSTLAQMIKEEHKSIAPVLNIMLYGEAGAGKSTAAKILAQLLGLPYRCTNLSLNSEESDLIGSYRPKEDGTFEFIEPAFAQTFKYGGVFEGMEPNYARPGALGCLNSGLDDTAQITLGNGEIVKRHPNCIIVFTTNVDYAGCQKLNESLKDRFQEIVPIEKMPNNDLIEITMRNSGNNDAKLVGKLLDAVQKISIKMVEEQITGGVCSTRQLTNWARKCKYVSSPIEAAKTNILPGVSLDPEIQKEIIDTILKPMF